LLKWSLFEHLLIIEFFQVDVRIATEAIQIKKQIKNKYFVEFVWSVSGYFLIGY
jgi:hypothetical protein